mmetsp:Transcript_37392/g.110382  ORF Transcript_37392/g.110382 Transcript_37392/m.110382 type:complete len:249 (+) Transcript_37392:1841-2587(+)
MICSSRCSRLSSASFLAWLSMIAACCFSFRSTSSRISRRSVSSCWSARTAASSPLRPSYSALIDATSARASETLASLASICSLMSAPSSILADISETSSSRALSARAIFFSTSSLSRAACSARFSSALSFVMAASYSADMPSSSLSSEAKWASSTGPETAAAPVPARASLSSLRVASSDFCRLLARSSTALRAASSLRSCSATSSSSPTHCSFSYASASACFCAAAMRADTSSSCACSCVMCSSYFAP